MNKALVDCFRFMVNYWNGIDMSLDTSMEYRVKEYVRLMLLNFDLADPVIHYAFNEAKDRISALKRLFDDTIDPFFMPEKVYESLLKDGTYAFASVYCSGLEQDFYKMQCAQCIVDDFELKVKDRFETIIGVDYEDDDEGEEWKRA